VKNFIIRLIPVIDLLLVPFVYPCGWLLKKIRWAGVHRLPQCKKALINIGVFPIRDHYFEPQFFNKNPRMSLSQDRFLPGINWNTVEQLEILSKLTFSQELSDIQQNKTSEIEFHISNGSFGPGDAEYWYQIIRLVKPKRIFEVGSGNSTLMAIKAVRKNREEDPNYQCKLLCIQHYESPWLEEAGVTVVRKKVEDLELEFFSELGKNDILFIDSSHVIRPQGDVLFECLELLPTLNNGVIVHFHDVFSPKNYPQHWVEDEVRLWNEQYLLEAFLTHNNNWKIMAAINFLKNSHYEKLKSIAPFLTSDDGPGSFYIKKVI